MRDMSLLRPKEVCERLGVSSATLRRWSDVFADRLSPTAGKALAESGGAAQRRYSEEDFAVLARVKRLLDAGNTVEEAQRKLDEPEPIDHFADADKMDSPTPSAAVALTEPLVSVPVVDVAAWREALAAKDEALRAKEQTIRSLELALADKERLVEELERRPVAVPAPSPVLPALTLWQRIDWLVRGRMLG